VRLRLHGAKWYRTFKLLNWLMVQFPTERNADVSLTLKRLWPDQETIVLALPKKDWTDKSWIDIAGDGCGPGLDGVRSTCIKVARQIYELDRQRAEEWERFMNENAE
jgi:hypothetical protein